MRIAEMDASVKKAWQAPSVETLEVSETRVPGENGNACDHNGQGTPPFCS